MNGKNAYSVDPTAFYKLSDKLISFSVYMRDTMVCPLKWDFVDSKIKFARLLFMLVTQVGRKPRLFPNRNPETILRFC